MSKLSAQITAIKNKIAQGKVKNIYAANNKLRNLTIEEAAKRRAKIWQNYLAK
jgi:subtilase family serine protease